MIVVKPKKIDSNYVLVTYTHDTVLVWSHKSYHIWNVKVSTKIDDCDTIILDIKKMNLNKSSFFKILSKQI